MQRFLKICWEAFHQLNETVKNVHRSRFWELLGSKLCKKYLRKFGKMLFVGPGSEKNRFFSFQSKVTITSNSKLKLDIVHLKTYITVHYHVPQTRTFWEWSRDRICGDAFYNKISKWLWTLLDILSQNMVDLSLNPTIYR